MYKHFLKPLGVVLVVYLVTALGIAADIAALTSFNFLNYINKNSPQSYYFIISGTFLFYISLVIHSFLRKENNEETHKSEIKTGQNINTRNVKNSTIIQINNSKED